MQLQVEMGAAKEIKTILGLCPAMHFLLSTVSWEPANLAGIISKSWGMDLARECTGEFSAFPWRALSGTLRVLFISLPIGFLASPWED